MSAYSRGDFLRLSAILAGAAAARLPLARGGQPPAPRRLEPDLVLVNGRVLTMEPAAPRAEAFAVKDGRFVAVGSTGDVRALASARTRVIDAARMTVVPGFIDCHAHPSGVNELYGVDTNLRSVRAIQEALRRKAAQTPPEQWVSGFMFDDTKLVDGPLHRRHL